MFELEFKRKKTNILWRESSSRLGGKECGGLKQVVYGDYVMILALREAPQCGAFLWGGQSVLLAGWLILFFLFVDLGNFFVDLRLEAVD